ncbi:hypothetical protein TPA0905_69820 [Streptomyces olivaceus]|nr:hypothetical protein TPA0905_69820 [Streptomyces olivaceus]
MVLAEGDGAERTGRGRPPGREQDDTEEQPGQARGTASGARPFRAAPPGRTAPNRPDAMYMFQWTCA